MDAAATGGPVPLVDALAAAGGGPAKRVAAYLADGAFLRLPMATCSLTPAGHLLVDGADRGSVIGIVTDPPEPTVTDVERLARQKLAAGGRALVIFLDGFGYDQYLAAAAYLTRAVSVSGSEVAGTTVLSLTDLEEVTPVRDSFAASKGVSAYQGVILRDLIEPHLATGVMMPTRVRVYGADGYVASAFNDNGPVHLVVENTISS